MIIIFGLFIQQLTNPWYKTGERQLRAPGQIGEHGPPVPLDSHADGHTKVYIFNRNQRGNRQRITCKK